jgi:hypothetical protein
MEQQQEALAQQNQKPQMSDEEIQKFLASLEDKPERTPRSTFNKGGAKNRLFKARQFPSENPHFSRSYERFQRSNIQKSDV